MRRRRSGRVHRHPVFFSNRHPHHHAVCDVFRPAGSDRDHCRERRDADQHTPGRHDPVLLLLGPHSRSSQIAKRPLSLGSTTEARTAALLRSKSRPGIVETRRQTRPCLPRRRPQTILLACQISTMMKRKKRKRQDWAVTPCRSRAARQRSPPTTGTRFPAWALAKIAQGFVLVMRSARRFEAMGRWPRPESFILPVFAKCAEARSQKCTPCSLSGPSTLNPGEEGVWSDGKGNSAEVSGGNALTFVSRDFETGYRLRMPTGGQGPFPIKVCYGETEDSCCEAEVDFPPCSLSGVTTLEPGVESLYLPSAGMDGAVCTCGGDMEFVRIGGYGVGFVCRMKEGGCEGTVTVTYGGRVCGTVTVINPLAQYIGSVVGDMSPERGEVVIYYHDLGDGADLRWRPSYGVSY